MKAKSLFVGFLILPYLVFYWLCPYVSALTLGQDFGVHGFNQQLHLMFSLKQGTFPLYMPGYAGGGLPATALSQGQIFHPISYLSSLMPGYWDGQALHAYTFFCLLSIGLALAYVYSVIRQFHLSSTHAFLISFITIFNLRMLDLFRYGAALQNYLAMAMLCAACFQFYLKPKAFWSRITMIVFSYLLICGGHPQITYYGFVGIALVILLAPWFVRDVVGLEGKPVIQARSYFLQCFGLVFLGVLLASVFILPFYMDFMTVNSGRGQASYSWSLGNSSIGDIVIGFFAPWHSNIHGTWGGSPIGILLFVMPLLIFYKHAHGRKFAAAIMLCLIVLWMYGLGDILPLHHWAWVNLPFVAAFRIPERVHVIFPMLFLMLYVWLLRQKAMAMVWLSGLAVLSYGVFLILPFSWEMGSESAITPHVLHKIPPIWVVLTHGLGLLSLIFLFLEGFAVRGKKLIQIALIFSVIMHAAFVFRYGTFVEAQKTSTTYNQMAFHLSNRPTFLGPSMEGMFSKDMSDYLTEHKRSIDRDPLFALFGAKNRSRDSKATIEMKYISFNRLVAHVQNEQLSVLVLSYPISSHWKAKVNGVFRNIERVFDIKQGVYLNPGSHVVEFYFVSPATGVGMAMSLIILMALLSWSWSAYCRYLGIKKLWIKSMGHGMILIVMAGSYCVWWMSLYGGNNVLNL